MQTYHTLVVLVFITANFGYVAPNSRGEPAGGIRTRDPIGSGDTCPNTPTTCPLVQRGYSSVVLQDPQDERDGVHLQCRPTNNKVLMKGTRTYVCIYLIN